MKIRTAIQRAAVASALSLAIVGATTATAQALPRQGYCGQLVQSASYYNDLGQNFTVLGNAWLAAGFPEVAQRNYDDAQGAFGLADAAVSAYRLDCR
jgi:hypothetical protein